ncbi:hypothetical protein A2U01_0112252, partial [Trifolium medium]|nr:hypothetical protein [Trifolium medium]
VLKVAMKAIEMSQIGG